MTPERTPPLGATEHGPGAGGLAIGVVLMVLGIWLLAAQAGYVPAWLGGLRWPFLVAAIGAGLLALAALGGRETAPVAIPGSIVTMVGLVLAFMDYTQQWQTMAYAWALMAPTGVGVGIFLQGLLRGDLTTMAAGERVALVGLALFAGLGVFFEVALGLSGFVAAGFLRSALPIVLVAAGVLLLLVPRPSRQGLFHA